MKPQTHLRLSLLVPYMLWGITTAPLALMMHWMNTSSESNETINIIFTPVLLYTYGIVIWGIPYTLLAVGLWLWSRNKHTQSIIKVFAFSPIMLAALIAIQMLAFFINWQEVESSSTEVSTDFGTAVLAVSGLALAYGYLCIGITAGIHKIFKALSKAA